MRKTIPIALAILMLVGIAGAQPVPTFTGLTIDVAKTLGQEYFDTITVDTIAICTLPQMLWFVEFGLVDTTDTDTFYAYPNSSGSTLSSRGVWGGAVPIRLLGAHPNKYLIPQKYSWGPLAISWITWYGWIGGGGANVGDSTQLIWVRGYTIPTGYYVAP